jgi:acetoin utilization protein AcuC
VPDRAPELEVVWDRRFLDYDFGPSHPFDERSRALAVDLFRAAVGPEGTGEVRWVESVDPAGDTELVSFHRPEYLELVRRLSDAGSRRPLDNGDTPAFPGCYDAAARVVAATAGAVQRAVDRSGRSFVAAGGLHHARPERASGFCIFNDLAVAIRSVLPSGRRVAYVDLDAHHGDGVMYGFYGSGRLLDIDLHQDGRTLFPGTGGVEEIGEGDGAGLKVNLPLPPGAGDEALVPLARRVVRPLLEEFRPELLLVQHGIDGHWGDPLAQLQYTAGGYAAVDRLLLEYARSARCAVVVTGGGGYRAGSVARVLARTGLLLAGRLLPPDPEPVPDAWVGEYVRRLAHPAPSTWGEPARLARSPWSADREERLVRELEGATGRRFPRASPTG